MQRLTFQHHSISAKTSGSIFSGRDGLCPSATRVAKASEGKLTRCQFLPNYPYSVANLVV